MPMPQSPSIARSWWPPSPALPPELIRSRKSRGSSWTRLAQPAKAGENAAESQYSSPYDLDLALARCANDPELLAELVPIFLGTLDDSLKELREAWQTQDLTTTGRVAHTLKNSADNLGALRAREFAFELESRMISGKLADTAALVSQVTAEFTSLEAQLRDDFRDDFPRTGGRDDGHLTHRAWIGRPAASRHPQARRSDWTRTSWSRRQGSVRQLGDQLPADTGLCHCASRPTVGCPQFVAARACAYDVTHRVRDLH